MHSRFVVRLALLAGLCAAPASAQMVAADPPPVPREFRAAWVATVANIDWPSKPGLTTWDQQRELIAILDKLVQLHMNAIVLQVRPAADALYQSNIEPWSDFLTGELGRAPEPFYDPLTFAVDEAHKRGLELHVWINPYRAKHPATKVVSPGHISRTQPALVRSYGPYLWMDPGDPAVRALTERVVLDLVKRYDIDGVHMDDYFYPYPESANGKEIDFPDDATFARYQATGGTLTRPDWRRENVNLLVHELNDGIHAAKPWVKFGVSPFGIWRPGNPETIKGFDQYAKLYADAKKWLNEGWVDYFTPQLYWAIDTVAQSYPVLLKWWSEQNTHARHLWPGNYTGRVGFTTPSRWGTQEVLNQIAATRAQPGATGNVHFSMKVFQQDPDSLDEKLLRDAYGSPALVPATPWLHAPAQGTPTVVTRVDASSGDLVLDLTPAPSATTPPWLWVIRTKSDSAWSTLILPGSERTHVLAAPGATPPSDVRVMAVDRLGNSSPDVRIAPRR